MENVIGSVTGITRIRSNSNNYIPKKLYECVSYRKYGTSRCVCHNIREDFLLANFKQFLITLRDNYKNEIESLKLKEYKTNKQNDLNELKQNLKSLETEYKTLLNEKIKELSLCSKEKQNFVKTTYETLEDEKYKEIQKLKNQIKELSNEKLNIKQEKITKAIDYFNKIIEMKIPDKAVLNMLIDKIYIYHDKSVKFELKVDMDKIFCAKKNYLSHDN